MLHFFIYSTNTRTEYFKHAAYSLFFPLQNAVYFITLPFLVPVLFTFYIQVCSNLEENSGAKRLKNIGEENTDVLRKTCPVPPCQQQISHGLTRDRLRLSTTTGQRLNTNYYKNKPNYTQKFSCHDTEIIQFLYYTGKVLRSCGILRSVD